MRIPILAVASVAVLSLTASSVEAQQVSLPARGYISVNGGYQASATEFADTIRFTENAETGILASAYEVQKGPQFDLAAGFRVWRSLSAGVGVTRFTRVGSAAVSAQIPHPFFFDRNRGLDADVSDLTRDETAVHVQLMAVIPVTKRITAAVFGGPSFFTVKQDLVGEVSYRNSYPFDAVTFSSADIGTESRSAVGFNAGVDVGYFFTSSVGVGGVVRFSRAAVEFDLADGRALSVDAGGLQAGAGLRLRF